MKLPTLVLTALKLLAFVLMVSSTFSMATAIPIPKTSTTSIAPATPTGSSQDVNDYNNLQEREHKSAPYYLYPGFNINMSQDRKDFVPGTLHDVTPRGGVAGALYMDIMYYQQGTLRLKTENNGPDIWIPNTWYCDANRSKSGCIGSNFINPNDAIPHTKLRYDGDRAYLYEKDYHAVVFEKINNEKGKGLYRYLPPGAKPWDRAKWEKENGPKPKCKPDAPFGIGKKLCDFINELPANTGAIFDLGR
ncbi:hypothetical protein E2P81_ATG11922 [Venturia nashicola]|uniref:Uncharacterized protein n=1 Tax=Venturia nashicola TaxID=86259 RepID=A0A4Z1P7I1_9PEZI|nr:hypothetical protein E6O75_ATG11615 [Venturia nashicola]TLD24586.1 hypothetical protein E2P81_ATG11922 [Venturia nashicola]